MFYDARPKDVRENQPRYGYKLKANCLLLRSARTYPGRIHRSASVRADPRAKILENLVAYGARSLFDAARLNTRDISFPWSRDRIQRKPTKPTSRTELPEGLPKVVHDKKSSAVPDCPLHRLLLLLRTGAFRSCWNAILRIPWSPRKKHTEQFVTTPRCRRRDVSSTHGRVRSYIWTCIGTYISLYTCIEIYVVDGGCGGIRAWQKTGGAPGIARIAFISCNA